MNTKRDFLKGLSATTFFGFGAPNAALAEYTCSRPQPYNGGLVRQCSVGFRIRNVTARQRCDQWCWAACIEAAFRLYGHRINQEEIVRKIFGPSMPCRPSIGPEIASAVEGYWRDRSGDEFYATTRTHTDISFGIRDPYALQRASEYLASDVPVIIGAVGHATILTAMTWIEDNFGNQQLQEIIVRDPWPGTPNRRQFSAQELYGTSYLAAVLVD